MKILVYYYTYCLAFEIIFMVLSDFEDGLYDKLKLLQISSEKPDGQGVRVLVAFVNKSPFMLNKPLKSHTNHQEIKNTGEKLQKTLFAEKVN